MTGARISPATAVIKATSNILSIRMYRHDACSAGLPCTRNFRLVYDTRNGRQSRHSRVAHTIISRDDVFLFFFSIKFIYLHFDNRTQKLRKRIPGKDGERDWIVNFFFFLHAHVRSYDTACVTVVTLPVSRCALSIGSNKPFSPFATAVDRLPDDDGSGLGSGTNDRNVVLAR